MWQPVIRRTAFDTVCDKYSTPLQIASLEEPVEKLPGMPTEGVSALVFKVTGCLADEENWGVNRSFTGHRLPATFM
jgi:hypothetical protein